ncbi:hypothetical protein J6590_001991 [Homalodisca vitripennis]|nr:hypothetical protein J6590_001991 [Homalodisca vitripennis]
MVRPSETYNSNLITRHSQTFRLALGAAPSAGGNDLGDFYNERKCLCNKTMKRLGLTNREHPAPGWQWSRRAGRRLDVPLHVECQVVGAGEAPVAVAAFEGFGARVFPVVTGQLVGPRETPAAALPLAFVWLLSCNTHGMVSDMCNKLCRRNGNNEGIKEVLPLAFVWLLSCNTHSLVSDMCNKLCRRNGKNEGKR